MNKLGSVKLGSVKLGSGNKAKRSLLVVMALAASAISCGSTVPRTATASGGLGATAGSGDQGLGADQAAQGGTPSGQTAAGATAAAAQPGQTATGGAMGATATGGQTSGDGVAASGPSGPAAQSPSGPLPSFPNDGVTSDSITFGSILPVSSGFAQVFDSKTMARLVQKLTDQVNAHGGINGRKLKYVWLDDGFDPTKGAQVTKQLVEQEHVLSIVSPISTFTTANTAGYLKANNVADIAPEGYEKEAYTYPNFFPVTNYFDVQGRLEGHYLSCVLGFKRVAVFSIGNFQPSKDGGDAIVKAVQECGGQVVDRENPNFSDVNYTPYILRARGANPDVLASAQDPLDDAVMLTTAQAQNFRPPKGMMFLSAFSLFKTIAAGAGNYANGFYSVAEFDSTYQPDNLLLKSFLPFAQSIGIDGTDPMTLEVWAGFEIFITAAKAAGANLNRGTMMQALNSLNLNLGMACQPFAYQPGPHSGNPCLRVVQWNAPGRRWDTLVPFQRVS